MKSDSKPPRQPRQRSTTGEPHSRPKQSPRSRPLHPKERLAIAAKEGAPVLAPQTRQKKEAAPAGTTDEKRSWLKQSWDDLKLPKGAWTAPRSLPDPLDSGYGDSYTTVQEHYGTFLLKALSKEKQNRGDLALSPLHLALYKTVQQQLQKPHLAPLRSALVALHLRSTASNHHLMLQCRKTNAQVLGAAKKMAEWCRRELETVIAVHFVSVDSPKPLALGYALPFVKLRTLYGPERLEIPFGNWERPLLLHPLEGARPHRPLWSQMVRESVELLQLQSGDAVVDLCSGSGVFGIEAARSGAEVVSHDRKSGVEQYLKLNAAQQRVAAPRFWRGELEALLLKELLATLPHRSKMVLDLPGMPLPPGIPTACSKAEVERVVRIYSSPRQLESEYGRWKYNGYLLHTVRSYDHHPGGPGLELVALYRRMGKEFIERLHRDTQHPSSDRKREQTASNAPPDDRFKRAKRGAPPLR